MDPLHKLFKKAGNAENRESFFDDNELRRIIENVPLKQTFYSKNTKVIKMTLGGIITIGAIWLSSLNFGNISNDVSTVNVETQKPAIQATNTVASEDKNVVEVPAQKEIPQKNDVTLALNTDNEDTENSSSKEAVQDEKPDLNYVTNKYVNDIQIGSIKLSRQELEKVKEEILAYFDDETPVKHILWRLDDLAQEKLNDQFSELLNTAKKIAENEGSSNTSIAKIDLYAYIIKKLALDISGINKIKLNREELEKLGLHINNHTPKELIEDSVLRFSPAFWFLSEKYEKQKEIPDKQQTLKLQKLNYPVDEDPILVKERHNVFLNHTSMFNHSEEIIEYEGWNFNEISQISPVAYSANFYYGYYTRYLVESIYEDLPLIQNKFDFNKDNFDNMIELRNNPSSSVDKPPFADYLVPVLVEIGDLHYIPKDRDNFAMYQSDSVTGDYTRLYNINYGECTLWYYPTDEFLDALPAEIGDRLRKEIEIMKQINSGEITDVEGCEILKGEESLLGMCKMYSGKFKDLKVYPNPNQGNEISVSFLNLEKCNLNVYLHDASGHYLADLHRGYYQDGPVDMTLPLDNLSNGIYYINVSDEKGDNAFVKFIISK